MNAADTRSIVHAALRTVQGSVHHLDPVTLEVLTDRVTESVAALLDRQRAEVLAEADLLPKAQVVAWLAKKAREDTSVWLLASKADRGAIRPDNLRMLPPDFFEPGHSYTHRNGTDFHCVAVTAHPQSGERLAMGWHVDSWGLHVPTTVGIDQWRHEYDGVQAPETAESQHYDKVPDPADGCHWCACGNRWPCKDAGAVAP
ncbi:hypothetical protein MUK60_07755 [Streptomyces sp. LRE541]|uniref:hypothetical protein n=1 Tax=Streptomyces sp. LRE541 TaxID=2931983 RepID=UPI00200D7436|nr:hypothetical protein [Streptomyces sp. LRE541]UPZ27729.1 hypothetical protein MUK60_07755 [Streptomyces sp. LRE541]